MAVAPTDRQMTQGSPRTGATESVSRETGVSPYLFDLSLDCALSAPDR
jgi:hypothetical protein